jgi:AcrR family transcriptional regulator
MARTVDIAVHADRRDAFIEAAQRLMTTKGYEQMSIQDVLDEVGTSRGAFYHYYDSKAALLDGVVGRMVQDATASVEPVMADPGSSAIDKVAGLFSGIATWKLQRTELLLALMDVWLSDDNAIVRDKFRRGVATTLTPILASIVRQGVSEGSFHVTSPEHSARALVSLIVGLNEHATDLFFARQEERVPFEYVDGAIAAYTEAFERILGARPGSLRWFDRAILHQWFG